MKRVCAILAIVAVSGLMLGTTRASDEKPKQTIKEVMKNHKDKLHEKYQKGEASKEERQKLLDGYEALVKNKPPKGEDKSWKEKTEALVKAVKDDDKEAFKKAYNCGACHGAHKA